MYLSSWGTRASKQHCVYTLFLKVFLSFQAYFFPFKPMDILSLFTLFFCAIENGLISTEFDHKNYILTCKWLCSSLDICKWFCLVGGFKGLIWDFTNLIVCGWNGFKLQHGLWFKLLQIVDDLDAKSSGKEIEFIEWLLQVSFVERCFNKTWTHIVYLGRLSCKPHW